MTQRFDLGLVTLIHFGESDLVQERSTVLLTIVAIIHLIYVKYP